MRSTGSLAALCVAALLCVRCTSTASGPDAGGVADAGEAAGADAAPSPDAAGPEVVDAALPPVDAGPCDPHARTRAPRFTDATEAWGLGQSGLRVTGNRLSVADLDGDGFPDLVVHAIYTDAREVIGEAPKRVWVLMNRPKQGGGRAFVDATVSSGVFALAGNDRELRSAQLAVAGDVDNDGDLDLFSGTYVNPLTDPVGDRSAVLLNDGTGHFLPAKATPELQLAQTLSGATFTDVDRDGLVDLFLGFWYWEPSAEGFQHELFKGRGDGTFVNVTRWAGLELSGALAEGKAPRPAYGATSCDLDGDGAPELLLSAYGRQWNLAYRNDGTGRFREVGRTSGYAGDANLDYHDNQFFLCWCATHPTAADCQGVPKPSIGCSGTAWSPGYDDQPFRLNGNTFTTLCADLDGDGRLDLYNAEIHHWWAGQSSDSSELLVSRSTPGTLAFERPGNAVTGMSWPHPTSDWNEGGLMAAAGDLDNDARPDVLVGASDYPDQRGLLFRQVQPGRFEEVAESMGLAHPCLSGLAVADFDRDGDLDVVVGSGTARDCAKTWKANEVHFYENDASQVGHWLALRLSGDGKTANRAAIGARVTVTASGVAQVQEVGGGYGHMGMQSDAVLFFGLGACARADSVKVRWPDKTGTVATLEDVEAGRVVELRQAP